MKTHQPLKPFRTVLILALWLLFALAVPGRSPAAYPAAEEILKRVDANISSDNRVLTSKMIVRGPRGSRTITSRSWIEGETRSFTEYLAPAREKGTKMLKLGDQLWMYSPDTDRTIQISGHMLRQSVMGSDLSYEDMLEDSKLHEAYDGVVIGEEQVDDRACWVLDLTAHTASPAYHQRKLWVDQEREIPLKEELFAKGGKLLKRLELKDVVRIQQRWFPKRMIFKDVLKSGDGTEFIIEDIEFNSDIAPDLFSKASLRR